MTDLQTDGWQPIETFPTDGREVQGRTEDGHVIDGLFYGFPPIGRGGRVIRGTQNVLSPHVTLTAWREKPVNP